MRIVKSYGKNFGFYTKVASDTDQLAEAKRRIACLFNASEDLKERIADLDEQVQISKEMVNKIVMHRG